MSNDTEVAYYCYLTLSDFGICVAYLTIRKENVKYSHVHATSNIIEQNETLPELGVSVCSMYFDQNGFV